MMNKYNFITKIVFGGLDGGCNIIRVYTDGIIMEGEGNISYPDMVRVDKHDVSLIRRACKGKIRRIAKIIPQEMEVVFYDCESPEDPCDPDDRYIIDSAKIPRSNIVRALGILYTLCTKSYAKPWKQAGYKM